MRAVILVCLLFVAVSCALPQSEVVAAENRIADMWLMNRRRIVKQFIKDNNLDPKIIKRHEFHNNIINKLVEVKGFVEDFEFSGIGYSIVHDMRYNIPLGLLNLDLEFPKLFISIGRYYVRVIFGDSIIELDIRGTLEITGIRIPGYAFIEARPGVVNILAINTNCRIDGFKSELTVIGAEDYSPQVNNFINLILPDFLRRFSREINNYIEEFIILVVNFVWP